MRSRSPHCQAAPARLSRIHAKHLRSGPPETVRRLYQMLGSAAAGPRRAPTSPKWLVAPEAGLARSPLAFRRLLGLLGIERVQSLLFDAARFCKSCARLLSAA